MEKRRDIRNIYIPEDFKPTWDKFIEICEREDESASEKIRGFIARYVAVHEPGNPQLLLETFIGELQSKCFKCEGIFKHPLHHVKFVSGLKAHVCNTCLEDYQRRGLVKKELKP